MASPPSPSSSVSPPPRRRQLAPRAARQILSLVACTAAAFASIASWGDAAVESIWVEPAAAGQTVIVIEAPARLPVRSYRLSGPPRFVLRFIGVPTDIDPHLVEVDDGRVDRVRAGHHPEVDPPELHVVIDLTDAGVEVVRTTRGPSTMRVTLARPEPSPPTPPPTATAAAPPTATSTSVPTVAAPTATATMTAPHALSPTATPSPSPSPTASPAPTESVTPRDTTSPTPPPTAPPTPSSTPTEAPPKAPAKPPATPSPEPTATTSLPLLLPSPTPTPASPRPDAPAASPTGSAVLGTILQVQASCRSDGTTLLRVSASSAIDDSAMEYLQAIEDPTRHVLMLEGYVDPLAPRTVEACGEIIRSLEVVPDPMYPQRSTRIVITLTDTSYDVVRGVAKGEHLVLEFGPVSAPQPGER